VHAVRGERERYRPLRSTLVDGADPVAVTRAVRDRLGLDELYVADLDAIAGGTAIRDAGRAGARGAGDGRRRRHRRRRVERLRGLGVARVIVGSETLEDAGRWGAWRRTRWWSASTCAPARALARPGAGGDEPGRGARAPLPAGVREAIVLGPRACGEWGGDRTSS
jgi:hypothetical protein